MTKADKKQLEVFENWIWRRTLKITWKDKITNVSVLRKSEGGKKHVEYNLATKTQTAVARLETKFYCQKLLRIIIDYFHSSTLLMKE